MCSFKSFPSCQKFLRHVYRSDSVCYCRHDLTQRFGPYIVHGIDAGQIGLSRLVCDDITASVEIELPLHQLGGELSTYADEHAVTRKRRFLTRLHILQLYAVQLLSFVEF